MKRISLSFFLVLTLLSCQKSPNQVKFVTLGHIYHVARDSAVFDRLLTSIESQHPNYVFVLGDMVWANVDWEWEIVERGFDRLDCPVYFVPGNHELLYVNEVGNGIDSSLQRSWDQYGERIGYYNYFFKDHLSNYILLNSNDSAPKINGFMDECRSQSNPELGTLIFSHHNLWEPGIKDYTVMGSLHHKGFEWPRVEKRFLGYSNFFYGDRRKDFGTENPYEGEGQSINLTGVGMGDKGDPVYYGLSSLDKEGISTNKILVEIPESLGWKP